jgi:hypothetical protein
MAMERPIIENKKDSEEQPPPESFLFTEKIGFQKKGSTFHRFVETPVNKGVAGVEGGS